MKLSAPYKGAMQYTITQGFKLGVHPALDMVLFDTRGGMGTPLCAPEDCTVIKIKGDGYTPGDTDPFAHGYGIWLKGLETGYTHLYWHTKPIFPVSPGQTVKRGEIVAFMGNSGYVFSGGVRVPVEDALSTYKGTHLHWEVFEPKWRIGKPKLFVDFSKEIDWNSQPSYGLLALTRATAVVLAKISKLIST